MGHKQPSLRILVDRRPTNMKIGKKGEEGYFAEVVLCIDQESGYIFVSDVLAPTDGDQAIGLATERTLATLRGEGQQAQVTWVTRQAHVAAALAARFPESEIVSASGADFAAWDEAYLSLDRHMGSGGAMLPYLWQGHVTAEEVAAMFGAAAAFYRARPWQFVSDDDPLTIPNPRAGEPPLIVSVMGGGGIARGIAIFDAEADFARLVSEESADNVVYASFERVNRVPQTVVAEAEKHGWTVVNNSAFPTIVRVQDMEMTPCRADDLQHVTIAFRSLAKATVGYRESRKRRPRRQASR